MSTTFTSVDDTALVNLVSQAKHPLVFVAPGVRQPVAKALAAAMDIVPPEALHLVLDVDAEVCRLGYGDPDLSGLTLLQQAATAHRLTVNHHPGIRIGLVIADDTTLIYSPTPLLIEAESKHPEKPNAIVLHNEIPAQLANACALGKDGHATLEVGGDPINTRKVEEVNATFTAFKDVTYQTFKDPEFRKLLDSRFGAQAVQRVFSEHDAAPEEPPNEPPNTPPTS